MTTPVNSFIQLPLDTGNTGKKRRTQSRIVGADTVHEDFVISTSKRGILGDYTVIAAGTIPIAAQNGTSTGVLWVYNPVGSLTKIAVKSIRKSCQFTASIVDMSPGYLKTTKFSCTGTGSATNYPPAPKDSTFPAAGAQVRVDPTGLTITLAGSIEAEHLPVIAVINGGGINAPTNTSRSFLLESDEIILRAGEGIVIYNSVAVTTANRSLIVTIDIQEFE